LISATEVPEPEAVSFRTSELEKPVSKWRRLEDLEFDELQGVLELTKARGVLELKEKEMDIRKRDARLSIDIRERDVRLAREIEERKKDTRRTENTQRSKTKKKQKHRNVCKAC
jgi:hypothetical protein